MTIAAVDPRTIFMRRFTTFSLCNGGCSYRRWFPDFLNGR
jgi:hypothetical protein